ncbi:MAG: hypothetical protein JST11_19195 [Acidobacteria bacterium]|nr:hypothetical protein [Acidobacteriota bacterium]
MTREEARKLLGGYATGTLTGAEREALFAAAMEDQELFDALAREEALREALSDPSAKAELLAALEEPEPRAAWWSWRPLIGAVAMAGIALAAVAVWRATREKPRPVIVAQVEKAPAPAPMAAAPPAPAPPPPVQARPRRQEAKPAAKPAADTAMDALKKDEANAPAEAAAAPPPPPPPALQQQPAKALESAPSPRQQQIQVQAQAPELRVERAAAVATGFRDAKGGAAGVAGGLAASNLVAPLLQWTILRGDREAAPNTVLDAGETVRLRILARASGTLTLREGDQVLVTSPVESMVPFETPPLPATQASSRVLRLTLTPPGGAPLTLSLNLRYNN